MAQRRTGLLGRLQKVSLKGVIGGIESAADQVQQFAQSLGGIASDTRAAVAGAQAGVATNRTGAALGVGGGNTMLLLAGLALVVFLIARRK